MVTVMEATLMPASVTVLFGLPEILTVPVTLAAPSTLSTSPAARVELPPISVTFTPVPPTGVTDMDTSTDTLEWLVTVMLDSVLSQLPVVVVS